MSKRKGSVDLSDAEIAAINRERNAEHVSFRKKNDSAPRIFVSLSLLFIAMQLT